MSNSISMLGVPTFRSLESIALENTSMARNLGLSNDKFVGTKVEQVQKVTAVIFATINTNAFWGDIYPNSYPAEWQ